MSDVSAIDRVQWRALVIASLKTDLRTSGRSLNVHARPGNSMALVGSLVVFAAMGAGIAVLVAVSPDVYLDATALLFMLGFVIASSILIEYQAVVLSPDDYRQLAFQPVTSRTFFAARLTSLAIYVMAMTAAFSLTGVIALGAKRGGPLVAAAAAWAAMLEASVVTLLVVGLYVGVLKFVRASRLASALSYLQLALAFVVYGSYLIVPALLGEEFMHSASLPKAWWTLVNPASWFAGWVTLAAGGRTGVDFAGPMLSLLALLASGWFVAGRLSMDYAQRLGEIGEAHLLGAGRERGRPLGDGWLFSNGEARAIALLVRAQFRYDHRFRMTVLSIVPLTVLYLFAGLRGGNLDPFSVARGESLVYFAVMFFPPMLRGALSQSDAYRAAWVFHGTPASKSALVVAAKQFVVVGFLLPYLLLLGVFYVVMVGKPGPILLHMMVLALISHLVLLMDLLLNPDVPFSVPVRRSGLTATTIVSIVLVTLVAATLQLGLHIAYATIVGTIALIVGLLALNLVGEIALRLRLDGLGERAEFDA
jgi:hypothetical protein